MISVTIEYFISQGFEKAYEALAEKVYPDVHSIDGFISVEGFESRSEPGKRLSLSYWRDEDAVKTWRRHPEHVRVMKQGKEEIFSSYRITVSSALRDYSFQRDV